VTWLLKVRIGIAAMGIVVWAYAVRVGDRQLSRIGIIMLALSLALRFFGRRRRDDTPAS
jgi:hypothetical protein